MLLVLKSPLGVYLVIGLESRLVSASVRLNFLAGVKNSLPEC